jgi:hypothetical protein
MRKVGNDLLNPQRTDDIDKSLEVFLARECEHKNLSTFRLGHQPQTLNVSMVTREFTILVTIPKLDCVKSPSAYGPKP